MEERYYTYPGGYPDPRPQPKTGGRGRFVLFLVVLSLLACVGISLLVVFGGGVLLLALGEEGQIEVQVQPAVVEVRPGEQAEVTLLVANLGPGTVRLEGVRVPPALADAVVFREADPPFLRIEAQDEGPVLVYPGLPVEEGETLRLRLRLEGLKPGTYRGQWQVLTDVGGTVAFLLPVFVQEEGATQPAPTLPVALPGAGEEAPIVAATPTAAALPEDLGDLIERLARSVVMIVAVERRGRDWQPLWTGSGTIIDARGFILTNAHVAMEKGQSPDLLILVTQNTDEPPEPRFWASVVAADPRLDLAVLRIDRNFDGTRLAEPPQLPAVPLGDSDTLRLGDPLLILGYPGIGGDTITFTRGEVSGFVAQPGYGSRAWIKTSATIAGGSSGGLAANLQGELVGVPTRVGTPEGGEVVDCRYIVDTNGDGVVDRRDTCVPIGGFLNSLRPVNLARPLIQAALEGKQVQVQVPTPVPEPSSPSFLPVFRETFDNPAQGYWPALTDEDGMSIYRNGVFVVEVYKPQWLLWFPYREAALRNVLVKTRFKVLRPTGVGDVGVICRATDKGDFYAFSVSEDGYYAIWMQYQDQMDSLVPWARLPENVLQPGRWVEVAAACLEDEVALSINGTVVATAPATRLKQGYAGFVVGTFDRPGFRVAVDDFEVLEIETPGP